MTCCYTMSGVVGDHPSFFFVFLGVPHGQCQGKPPTFAKLLGMGWSVPCQTPCFRVLACSITATGCIRRGSRGVHAAQCMLQGCTWRGVGFGKP